MAEVRDPLVAVNLTRRELGSMRRLRRWMSWKPMVGMQLSSGAATLTRSWMSAWPVVKVMMENPELSRGMFVRR